MPREARFIEPEIPYHVTQRGNYQQNVFHEDQDRHKYLELLNVHSLKNKLEVWAYCLMDNHIHLIVYPRESQSLAKALATTHMMYAQYCHRQSGVVGHFWQGRFYSCALDAQHLVHATRYVEMNPVRARLVETPTDWVWSSARYHLGVCDDPLLDQARWPDEELLYDWKAVLEVYDDDASIQRLRYATRTGHPMGSNTWIKALEQRSGRRLHPLPVGRPRKR
ncbi:transposase IS200 like protein [bacterium BMS3Bbin04]|nr:transposase IS200 like protein [bacterium BMS3Bbin04]